MAEIILHHYPQSPVSEKVRVGLGIKGLAWMSVEIPRLPPKPDLIPLTGGYRRTPVMQIGADIYCDSQCILRELERRVPEPTFFPGTDPGFGWSFSRWIDGDVLNLTVKLVLGAAGDALPEDFARDRGRLYLGPDWDLGKTGAELPHIVAQLRAHFGWMDQRLAAGRGFMAGDSPGIADALVYYLIWFVRGRWEHGPGFLSEFSALEAWEHRIQSIGHGASEPLSSGAALEIAAEADPMTPERADPLDAQNLAPGMTVRIAPDGDGGDPDVTGIIRSVDRETIAILREDPRVGSICTHFPRVGYRVAPIRG